jgi:hypothetical protein
MSTGPGGLSYEHMQALVIPANRTDLQIAAHEALDHLLVFANILLATTTLPPYFFSLFAAIRLVASKKKTPETMMIQQIKTTAQLLMATAGVECLVKHAILSSTMRMLTRLVMNNLRMAVEPEALNLSLLSWPI